MAPLTFLLFLLSEAASDLQVVMVHPGDDVTLPCEAADSSISAVDWTRPDLEPEYVLYCSDGHLDPTHQHPSFKDRVELVDRELKDGDVSLILKNVNINDTGTYECRVAPAGSRRKKRAILDSEPIRIIRLQVTEPGARGDGGLVAGVVAGTLFLVAVAAVVGGLMYKRHRDNRPEPPAAEDTSTPLTT
ncbi:coxsackievirus and adenovirus receptor-like isoform X2 [Sander lucioperca]|uniref:coxsackievirus and adenovirus receptor-like isoform X2 n=1 Tax=Sander lucioperca TaxID=283035 RepID=UPI0016537656|nr:coxsackievirus and adenovirus receptor-like isoform X2 [Sander lucioperca]